MKTLEQIEKEERMFETLGIYYDSRESRLPIVPKELDLKVKGTLVVGDRGFTINSVVVGPDGQGHDVSRNSYLEDLINHYAPNMAYIEGPENDKWNRNNFVLHYEHRYGSIGFSYTQVSSENVFKMALERDGTIPATIEYNLKVVNKNSEEQIKQSFLKSRKGLTPEKYFKTHCSPDVDTNNTQWIRGKRLPKFMGSIRYDIMKKERRIMIFLIQYLYGHKMSRNATINDVYQLLRSIPYNDFGLRDVKALEKVVSVVNNGCYDVKKVKEAFEAIGLKPAKELRRWKELEQPKPAVVTTSVQNDATDALAYVLQGIDSVAEMLNANTNVTVIETKE